MAALPSVPKGVRLDLHFAQAADPNIMIRLHFQYAGTLNQADATTWLAAIVAALHTFVSATLVTDLSFYQAELTDLSSPTAVQVINTSIQAGGNTNAPLSAGVAMVMSYKISRRYRGGKPRSYIPGMSANQLSNPALWNPTNANAILADWEAFLGAATTTPGGTAIGAIQQVNISYYEGFVNHTYPSGRVKAIPQLRVTPLVDQITAVGVNPVPASQRRRNEQP